jgi:hypothetical protein
MIMETIAATTTRGNQRFKPDRRFIQSESSNLGPSRDRTPMSVRPTSVLTALYHAQRIPGNLGQGILGPLGYGGERPREAPLHPPNPGGTLIG